MFNWILGIEFQIVYWILLMFIFYLFILQIEKKLYYNYLRKVANNENVYFIPGEYKLFRKNLTKALIFLLLVVVISFILTRNKVYTVNELNSLDYTKLIQYVKEETKPDDGKIYYQPFYHLDLKSENRIEFTSEFIVKNIYLHLYFFREDQLYTVDIHNIGNAFIIKEEAVISNWIDIEDYIKNNYDLIDEVMNSINKINLNHLKSNVSLFEDEFPIINLGNYNDLLVSECGHVLDETLHFIIQPNGEIYPLDKGFVYDDYYQIRIHVTKIDAYNEDLCSFFENSIYYYLDK